MKSEQSGRSRGRYQPFVIALEGQWLWMLCSVLLLVAATTLELLPHWVVYRIGSEILSVSPELSRLRSLAAWCFAGILLRFLLLGIAYLLSHRVAFAVMRSLRQQLCEAMSRISLQGLSRYDSGDRKKLLIDDVARIESIFAHFIPELASAALVPLIAASVLFWEDWRMGALGLAMAPIAIGVQAISMRGIKESFAEWHAAEARANEGVLEFIRGIVVLKAFDRDASSLRTLRDGVYGLRDLACAMTKRTTPGYATFFALLSGNLLLVIPGGLFLFLEQAITAQQFVLFVILGSGLLLPLQRLIFLFGGLHQSLKSIERILAVMDDSGGRKIQRDSSQFPESNHLSLRGLQFRYTDAPRDTLHDVSLELGQGATHVVVGPSGSGKTTLLRLIVGGYPPAAGEIQLGGQRIDEEHWEALRERMSYVSQETVLFNASVEENLRLAKPDATALELERALRAAFAWDFVKALPEGLSTSLGDRGHALSGGQRQRLAIARAILKDSPILLLDEICSQVDPESERCIQASINEMAQHKTVLMVAHRLASHVDADQIIVMDQGRVAGTGTHQELLESCSVYARLWDAQEKAQGWMMQRSPHQC